MFLTELSLKRPVLATVCILALVALGLINYAGLGLDEFPPAEFPYVTVTIVQPGASPDQIENNVAKQVEDALSQISGVKHITSSCRDSVDMTFAEFTLETPVTEAVQNARDKIGAIRSSLPVDCEEPIIASYDPTAQPVISLALTGDASLREMTAAVNDVVKPKLETISGVGSVSVYGAEDREIHLDLDQNKLARYGLTTTEILTYLKGTNIEAPAGKVSAGDNEYSLRTSGSLRQLEDFKRLVVARRSGQAVYLQDIAQVTDGVKAKDSLALFQGQPAIGIDILKQSGTNTVQVAGKVMAAYAEIQKELPANIRMNVVKDNSINTKDSVNDVLKTIVEGAILAVLTVLLFLGNWRTTMISAIAIPTSVISTFTIMKALNFTLNIMSLTALSLSVGLLIDDAIVVIENIERHRRMGKSPLTATKEATSEIGLAVMATTFSLVAVFLPIGMLTGVVGQFFKQFGITVVSSVLISLLVSFTLVPMLSSRYLQDEVRGQTEPGPTPVSFLQKGLNLFNRGFTKVTAIYTRLLEIALQNRLKVVSLAAGLFVASLFLAAFLGTDFIPKADLGKMNIVVEPDAGQTQEATLKKMQEMDRLLKTHPEVTKTYATVQDETVNMYVELVARGERKKSIEALAQAFRAELKAIPGIRVSVSPSSIGPTGDLKNVEFDIVGDDDQTLQAYAEKVQRILESLPGAVDVTSSNKPGNPETVVEVDQDKASDLGVLPAQAVDALRTLYNGVVVSQFNDGQERVDIRVQLRTGDRESLDNLNLISLQSSTSGQMIPLKSFTKQVFAPAASVITRYDKLQRISLSANVYASSTGEINKAFLARVAQEAPVPAGCQIVEGKMTEMMGESLSGMSFALLMAILFIVFILAAQFESYIDPLAVLLSLPLAAVGAVLGLLVMGNNINLISMIGIIMLMGLVTKNAILLIDFTRREMRAGTACTQALVQAGKTRLRPIVMTTMAMILGMIPMALGLGTGGETRAPMAYAIIGGLTTSTLLTLVVVPVIYSLIQDLKRKVGSHSFQAGNKSEMF
jgi:hydrophobe/amphiphile efflux-1 (HAE1) family protein